MRTAATIATVLAIVVAVAVAAVLATPGVEIARRSRAERDFDPASAPPPWNRRCRIAIAAYEDGSASLYCDGRRRSFARVDAESGRIRMRRPPAGR